MTGDPYVEGHNLSLKAKFVHLLIIITVLSIMTAAVTVRVLQLKT